MPSNSTRPRVLIVLAALVSSLLFGAAPASAACHVAAFVETQVSAAEGEGTVTLTVFLQGRQPSCEGTVDWATQPGSATAGDDFVAGSGTLTFVAGDDREESFQVGIVDDGVDEPDEMFTVALSNPTQGISSTADPATVTVIDDDEPAPTPTPTEQPSQEPSPSASPTPGPTEPSATPSETATPPASDEPSEDPPPSEPTEEPSAAPEPEPTASTQAPPPTPAATPSDEDVQVEDAEPSETPSSSPAPTPEPDEPSSPPDQDSPTAEPGDAIAADEPAEDDGGGPLVPIVVGLLVIAGLAAVLTRRAS